MKIRTGFVSNSSSSSFLIFGVELDAPLNDWEDKKFIAQVKESGLEIFYTPFEQTFIGRSYDTIKDNETGKQFKEDIQEKVLKVLDESKECLTISEAWYDG